MKEITHFKVSAGELHVQSKEAEELFKSNDLLELIPDIVLVLNTQRQIIYSNRNLLDFLDIKTIEDVIGKRAGEVFNCIHAFENELGCGSTVFCNECGAHKSILSSLDYQKDVKECRIIQKYNNNALDLKVWTNPIVYNEKLYILFSLRDISSQKRKEVLERIFFHDILNTVTSIKAIMELIDYKKTDDFSSYQSLLKNSANKLLDEIYTQRELLEAESSTLNLNLSLFYSVELINGVIDIVKFYDFAKNINIEMSGESVDFTMISDRSLIGRVLTNLLKNAVESESPEGTVIIGCKRKNNYAHFWVNNKSVMPNEVKLQIFQRSFSTKGKGRGIGTYSVKLLTEKYLKGKVEFSSDKDTGTTFNVFYPLNLEQVN